MKLGEYTSKRIPHIVARVLADVDLTLRTAEARHVARVLDLVDGNISLASPLLGIPRRTLQRKLKRR